MRERIVTRTLKRKSSVGLRDLYKVRDKLKLSFVPQKIVSREEEQKTIEKIVSQFMDSETCYGSGLYISGMPGTGKTTCVDKVIRKLGVLGERKKKRCVFVKVNAMKLTTPKDIFSEILKGINGQSKGQKNAIKKLNSIFSGDSSADSKSDGVRSFVILIDELDCLISKSQNILYTVFDWPSRYKTSKILIIGIANTINLPEKLLQKINSRIGSHRLVFEPYNRTQIERIISKRLEGTDLFETEAIEFCARKISSLSGDIRQALGICSKAIANIINSFSEESNAKNKPFEKITIAAMIKAVNVLENSVLYNSVRNLSFVQKIIICAIVMCLTNDQTDTVAFDKIYLRSKSILSKIGENLSKEEALKTVFCLKEQNLLNFDENAFLSEINPKIDLCGNQDDIKLVFEDDEMLSVIFE